VADRCWWCGHPVHKEPCVVSWRAMDEEGICECVRLPEESDEKVVTILASAIAEALRGPGATVRQSDMRKARASLRWPRAALATAKETP